MPPGQGAYGVYDRDEAWIEVRFAHGLGGGQFTYVSERAGGGSYLVPRAGEAKKVTRGKFDIIRMLKLYVANGLAYFIASPKNATERYLYCIGLDGKGLKRLSPAKQRGCTVTVYRLMRSGRSIRSQASSRRRSRN